WRRPPPQARRSSSRCPNNRSCMGRILGFPMMRQTLVVAAVVGLAACSQVRAAPPGAKGVPRQLPHGDLSIEGEGRQKLGLQVRIAETDRSRQEGLMGVTRLSDQEGMAFLFTSPVSE